MNQKFKKRLHSLLSEYVICYMIEDEIKWVYYFENVECYDINNVRFTFFRDDKLKYMCHLKKSEVYKFINTKEFSYQLKFSSSDQKGCWQSQRADNIKLLFIEFEYGVEQDRYGSEYIDDDLPF